MGPTIVKRLNISPYQDPEYSFWEKEMMSDLSLPYLSWKDKVEHQQADSFVLISNTHTQWKEQPKQLLKKTKLIVHPNSGYDNFSLEFLRQIDCPVVLGNPIRAKAVANYILACLFSHFNHIPKQFSWDKTRVWNRTLLSEKKVLIIGHGHIGKLLEQSLKPVVDEVLIHDPYQNKTQNFKEILPKTNIIIPVAGLNNTSKHLVNSDFINQLPADFLLINAARGELVDNNALFTSLKERTAAFAYLDVFEKEPFDFRSVDHLSNIKLSSHIAGCFENLDKSILNFTNTVIKDHQELSLDAFNTKYNDLLLHHKIRDNELL